MYGSSVDVCGLLMFDVCWSLLFVVCCALRVDVCLLFVIDCWSFAVSHALLVVRWLLLLFGVICLSCVAWFVFCLLRDCCCLACAFLLVIVRVFCVSRW